MGGGKTGFLKGLWECSVDLGMGRGEGGGLWENQAYSTENPCPPHAGFINNLVINPSLAPRVGRGWGGSVWGAIPPFPPAIPRNLPGSNRIPLLRREDAGLEELWVLRGRLAERTVSAAPSRGDASLPGCTLGFS